MKPEIELFAVTLDPWRANGSGWQSCGITHRFHIIRPSEGEHLKFPSVTSGVVGRVPGEEREQKEQMAR